MGRLPEEVQVGMIEPDRVYLYNTFYDFGVLFIACLEPLSDEKFSIVERFGKVFYQSYTRFNDIQQAEAREKEAIKQSSLDRVRAEIASMINKNDLDRITPLIWRELTQLGVPFFRCGVFIMDELNEIIHAYLSTPTGEAFATLNLDFENDEILMIKGSLENWRKQQVYKDEWSKDEFIKNTQIFLEKGQIEDQETYQQGVVPPERLVLQFVPFKQGMLYVGSAEPLTEEQISLVQDLADSFSVAYSRYEDFVQLEEAKESVENTLTDLKSAQNQLVHSEKMASLGELTAGIAHEIQNPLNFVNNFSEVNGELIEELIQAIKDRDFEEVKAIAKDIETNEQKITHHGKRSEAIVKSMLLHSRGSEGKKEPTDINALSDEYLRLAYHGFRAKDKSFNADFNTELDEGPP